MTDWKEWNEKTVKTNSKAWENGFLKPLISFFPDLKGKIVLDIGCGNGEILSIIASQGVKQAWGIDLDKQALENCKKECEGLPVVLKEGNAENIPFEKEVFDIVYSIGLLEHFENPNKFLSEAKRVLKSEGILVIAVPNGNCWVRELKLKLKPSGIWERKYSLDLLFKTLSNVGFVIEVGMPLQYSPLKLKLDWWLLVKVGK